LPRGELDVVDHTEQWGDFDSVDRGFDDYHDPGNDDWDDSSQLDGCDDDSYVDDFDEACQLPPEEMAARLQRKKKASSFSKIRSGEDFGEQSSQADRWGQYRLGCTVQHPEYGRGEIVSASGYGPKRSVTICFEADGSRHTFRLSHVALEIER